MKSRLGFLALYVSVLLLFFMLQKPLFMLYNLSLLDGVAISDWFAVVVNGLKHDIAISGYLSVIPLLILIPSCFTRRILIGALLIPYWVLVSALLSAIFIGDVALYPYWKFKLDATIFTFLATPKQAFASASVWMLVVGVLLVVMLSVALCWLLVRITPSNLVKPKNPIVSVLCLLLVGGFLFLGIRGGVGKSTNNIGTVYFSGNQILNHSAVNPAFSLFYSSLKKNDFRNECHFFEESKREEIFNSLYSQKEDSVSMVQFVTKKRPDILLIILESFSAKFVSVLGGMPDVTPSLDSIIENGVSFSNCYANSFRTDRGVVSILSGYLGMPNATIMKMSNKCATLPSIAASLSRVGYSTQFVYGGDINFTNMSGYLLSTGFQSLVSEKDFPKQVQGTNAWGVNDEHTFKSVTQMVTAASGDSEPTFTAFLTLSSHDPFEVPYHKFDEKVRNTMSYTDYYLGLMIDELRKSAAWDNLLIACVADHGYCYSHEGNGQQPVSFHIPMVFTGGAVRGAMKFDQIINQSDFSAILLSQLGLSHDDFIFSRNVLGSEYHTPFAMYSFIDGFGFIDKSGVTVYDNKSQGVIFSEGLDSLDARLNNGKAIIQSMYKDISER